MKAAASNFAERLRHLRPKRGGEPMRKRLQAVVLALAVLATVPHGLARAADPAVEPQPSVTAPAAATPAQELPPKSPETAQDTARAMRLGRHLSYQCSSCHRIDGVDNGMPSIIGWPTERFVATLEGYARGPNRNPVMVSVARALSAEQIAALATYYATLAKR